MWVGTPGQSGSPPKIKRLSIVSSRSTIRRCPDCRPASASGEAKRSCVLTYLSVHGSFTTVTSHGFIWTQSGTGCAS